MSQVIHKISIAVILLVIGFIGSQLTANAAFAKWSAVDGQVNAALMRQFESRVASSSDAYDLVNRSLKLIDKNQANLALTTLNQAVRIDPNYRDAWIWLGYAQLKSGLTNDAIISLEKAQRLDPIYPQTKEFLNLAYQMVNSNKR